MRGIQLEGPFRGRLRSRRVPAPEEDGGQGIGIIGDRRGHRLSLAEGLDRFREAVRLRKEEAQITQRIAGRPLLWRVADSTRTARRAGK
jgi:hypothetical protein